MIRIDGLTKTFAERRVLDRVSLEVDDDEIVAILGPSGAGKSTLLRIVAGLEAPDAGSVSIGGRDVTRARPQERGVGFVFQQFALFRHRTVRENLAFGLEVRGDSRAAIDERVGELLALTRLEGVRDRYPSELSGGERQRVAFARALAPSPRVLLLDEPFGSLDARVRRELRSWLAQLRAQVPFACVLVTHDRDDARALSRRVVVLDEGRVVQSGTYDELLSEPATPIVSELVGVATIPHGLE
jgi:sulfate transport system ATP-binding protein